MALALAAAQFTTSQGQPRTDPTTCDALYYGLLRTPDLPAAYRCYGADGDFQMQIIMAINGEGVRRSVKLIDDLFSRWERKDPGAALSGQNDSLRVALDSLRVRGPVTHLEFCKGTASSTLDSIRCDAIRQFLLEADVRQLLRHIAATLSDSQRVALENLRKAFDRFKEAENARGYQAFVTGSIRHTAQNEERDAIGIGEGYASVTKRAEQAWDEYRRSWIEMATTLSFPNMQSEEAIQAIETLLTVERVDELKHNILGVH